MRNFLKIIAVALVGVMSISLVACKSNGNSENIYMPPSSVTAETSGTHTDNSTPTEDYIIKDKTTEYKVVSPKNASLDVKRAVSEFVDIVNDITGVNFNVINAEEASYSANAKYIAIGTNLNQTDIELGDEFADDGYRLVTKGKTVFLLGYKDTGTQYACDDFLYRTLGVDWVHPDSYAYDKTARDIPLVNYDVTEIPDFAVRNAASYRTSNYRLRHWRQNTTISTEVMIGEWKEWVHNASYWLMQWDESGNEIKDSDRSIRQHNEWIANNKPLSDNHDANAVCFNANGDEESRKLMLDVALEKVKKALKKGLSGQFIPLSIEDNDIRCECTACMENNQLYKAYSASGLLFLNDLAKATREWCATEEGKPYADRDVKFTWLAYQAAWECPENITLDEDVNIWLANVNMDFTKSIYDEENKAYLDTMDKWFELSGKDKPVLTWFYNTNFNYYCAPYDDFNTIQNLYGYLASKNVYNIWSQGQGQSREFTGFYTYKLYLTSKLEWNVNADVTELKLRWFKGYFGDAWEPMFEWFENMQAWYAHCRTLEIPLGGYRSLYQNVATEAFHPRYVLENWMHYGDMALETIENLKLTDKETYDLLEERISREKLSPLYFLLEIYGATYSESELKTLRRTFYKDAVRTQLDNIKEHSGTLNEYVAGWDL